MSNLTNALAVQYPGDVASLRNFIPLLRRFSDTDIERIYEAYSETFAAQWITLDETNLDGFKRWLEE